MSYNNFPISKSDLTNMCPTIKIYRAVKCYTKRMFISLCAFTGIEDTVWTGLNFSSIHYYLMVQLVMSRKSKKMGIKKIDWKRKIECSRRRVAKSTKKITPQNCKTYKKKYWLVIHKLEKERFNTNELDYGLEGKDHIHTQPYALTHHPHTPYPDHTQGCTHTHRLPPRYHPQAKKPRWHSCSCAHTHRCSKAMLLYLIEASLYILCTVPF